MNLRQLFGREKGESARSQDASQSTGAARSDRFRPNAPRRTMSALGILVLEGST